MTTYAPGQEGRALRSTAEIRESYDQQAEESFAEKVRNPFFERYGRAVGRKLATFSPRSLLEVGCGDGVTLSYALEEMLSSVVMGVDISRRRIEIARRILNNRGVVFLEMDLFHLRFGDNAFDVVFTSHALEPNGGREVEGIRELYRVARQYVVLFEPDWYAAPLEGRARMRRLGYVTEIAGAIQTLGLDLIEYGPFSEIGSPLNPTACWVIKKAGHA